MARGMVWSYHACVAGTSLERKRRGNIEELPSGKFRVRVYAGVDPVTKREHYLRELAATVREAEKALTRLLSQVDERRNPRTTATMDQLFDRWLEVLDVELSTRRGYLRKLNKHIRPVLGKIQVAKVDIETLDKLYASLRKCRDRCGGRRRSIDHRTTRPHECDDRCGPHNCQPLAPSSIRQIHWIISGALERAVRWKWIALNPADHAAKPALPHPNPQPPSPADAARLFNDAWLRDPDWGMFVWLAMATGARRAELCGLRWSRINLDTAVVFLSCGRRTLRTTSSAGWCSRLRPSRCCVSTTNGAWPGPRRSA